MTLLAVTLRPDRVEVVTDGIAYSRNLRHVELVIKTEALPVAEPAVLTGYGDLDLSRRWRATLTLLAGVGYGMEEIDRLADGALAKAWDDLGDTPPRIASDVVHAWWDTVAGRGRVRLHRADERFVGVDLEPGMLLRPHPAPGYRPTVPETRRGWVALVERMRDDHAGDLAGHPTMPIGGDVTLTTIDPSGVRTETLHRIPLDDPAFVRLARGSAHPLGQLAPCPCGEPKVSADCCYAPADAICNCGSGRTWGDCCRLPAGQLAAASAALRPDGIGRNSRCPCGSGAKAKKCHPDLIGAAA